jgi:hypothetical protein
MLLDYDLLEVIDPVVAQRGLFPIQAGGEFAPEADLFHKGSDQRSG